eukprot:GEMP01097613.1.p1 GENE.GEMP01097613.1~~GEMP01097613.1.p1  ORF type:complete len:116 (-),score=22.35 GEMP01097613.1:412-759(-)
MPFDPEFRWMALGRQAMGHATSAALQFQPLIFQSQKCTQHHEKGNVAAAAAALSTSVDGYEPMSCEAVNMPPKSSFLAINATLPCNVRRNPMSSPSILDTMFAAIAQRGIGDVFL